MKKLISSIPGVVLFVTATLIVVNLTIIFLTAIINFTRAIEELGEVNMRVEFGNLLQQILIFLAILVVVFIKIYRIIQDDKNTAESSAQAFYIEEDTTR
ncbi:MULTISPECIES: hypothetical protein [unclassified Paenibacillus]|uniref:hypothetical protein n=1 Tax=unclassified Paenibacillus TaxID=185978 RepID=UPI0030F4E774